MRAIFMGLVYFAIIFALAFALGVLRFLAIAPAIGEPAAVLIEVPVVLAASHVTARALQRRLALTPRGAALAGILAFALTMAAEALLAGVLRGQGVGDWADSLTTPLGLAGLAGQLGFAAMPWLAARAIPPARS